jgi:hypothetical protein
MWNNIVCMVGRCIANGKDLATTVRSDRRAIARRRDNDYGRFYTIKKTAADVWYADKKKI